MPPANFVYVSRFNNHKHLHVPFPIQRLSTNKTIFTFDYTALNSSFEVGTPEPKSKNFQQGNPTPSHNSTVLPLHYQL